MKSLKKSKYLFAAFSSMIFVLMLPHLVYAQPQLPQRSITITPTQPINFGSFYITGSGGTITVGYDGSRTATGGIILLSSSTYQPAIFEIKLCQGRNVTINFDPTTDLMGSNGGAMTLDIGPTEKGENGSVFSTNSDCDFITPLRVGGTLHIPVSAIPGIYSGDFFITFNQE